MRLQQPTTLMPFMKHLIALACVARAASQYQIFRAIGSATGQGNDMVNVIRALASAKLDLTIITFTPLPFMLLFYIFGSMRTSIIQLKSAAVALVGTPLFFMGVTVFLAVVAPFFGMRLEISTLPRIYLFLVSFPVVAHLVEHLFFMCLIVVSAMGNILFSMRLKIFFHVCVSCAWMGAGIFPLIGTHLFFVSLLKSLRNLFKTFFATACKAIFTKFARGKVFEGSREKVKAFGTLPLWIVLGYSIHDISPIQMYQNVLGVRPTLSGHPQYSTPHYTTTPLQKQAEGVLV